MGCNCGGRSGGRSHQAATENARNIWRHTDPYGGKVDYASELGARIALNARGGKIEVVNPRTGEPIRH